MVWARVGQFVRPWVSHSVSIIRKWKVTGDQVRCKTTVGLVAFSLALDLVTRWFR